MSERWQCPNGHQWSPPEADESGLSSLDSEVCPVCGKAGQGAAKPTLAPDSTAARPARPGSDEADKDSSIELPSRHPLPSVPGFEILEVLGQGGMGVVYKSRQIGLDRIVALKMLRSAQLASDSMLARFEKEGRAVARLQHPHIAQIYEVGQFRGNPYLALEYADGGTLADRIQGAQPPRDAAQTVMTLARAMHYSHEQGIIHRDLKPANVLLSADDSPKICDFGLAKLRSEQGATQTGEVLGTPSYMAPEQASGVVKNIGPASDVYALGAILYELLTGRPPFETDEPTQTLLLVLSDDPLPPRRLQPRVPIDLQTICLKCLHKSAVRRYSSAEALAEDLQRYLGNEPIEARPIGVWERSAKWARRHPTMATVIVTSFLFLATLIVGGAWYNARLLQTNERLQSERNRSDRLFSTGREFARWVLFDHTSAITRLQGSTSAQEALVARLRAYLDQLTVETEDDLELAADVAAAYERVAEVQGDPSYIHLGKTAEALESYRAALAIRKRILEARPDNQFARFNYATCLASVGLVLIHSGDKENGVRNYQESLDYMNKLVGEKPEADELLVTIGILHIRLGDLDRDGDKLDQAIERYRKALAFAEKTVPNTLSQSDLDQHRSVLHSRLGEVFTRKFKLSRRREDLVQAKHHFGSVQGLAERRQDSAVDPRAALRNRDLAATLSRYGDLLREADGPQAALEAHQHALKLQRAHLQADPRSVSARREVNASLGRVGTDWQALDQMDKALPCFREAIEITRELVRTHPNVVDYRQDLWFDTLDLGSALMLSGKLDAAEPLLREGLKIAGELNTNRSDATALIRVAETHDRIGTLQSLRGNARTAANEKDVSYRASFESFQRSIKAYQAAEKIQPLNRTHQESLARVQRIVRRLSDKLMN